MYLRNIEDPCRVEDSTGVAVPQVQQLWVTPGLTSERFNPVKDSKLEYELRRCSVVIVDAVGVVIERFWFLIPYSFFCYHDRTSHEVRTSISLSFTGLSTSGTEPGVTHNWRPSGAFHSHRIFDTMRMSESCRLPNNRASAPNNRAFAPSNRTVRCRITARQRQITASLDAE